MNNKLNTIFRKLMMKTLMIAFFSTLLVTTNASAKEHQKSLTIGFGSCADQNKKQPIWSAIATHNPDAFILMGDNVYADSDEPEVIARAYKDLIDKANFAALKASTQLIATWDDHDYGLKDSGKEFAGKQATKDAFIDFFNYPELNELKNKEGGIYHTRWINFNSKTIQIIMLDTRWYRDPVVPTYLTTEQREILNLGDLQPTTDTNATLLGEEQWKWLESELQKPADMKILVSSFQVLAEYTGWESWANFPPERTKLLSLLDQTKNNKLIILSGDIHKAEISSLVYKNKRYVEITSSGLAVPTYSASVNVHRQGMALEELNYGMLNIKDDGTLTVSASIYDANGVERLTTDLASTR